MRNRPRSSWCRRDRSSPSSCSTIARRTDETGSISKTEPTRNLKVMAKITVGNLARVCVVSYVLARTVRSASELLFHRRNRQTFREFRRLQRSFYWIKIDLLKKKEREFFIINMYFMTERIESYIADMWFVVKPSREITYEERSLIWYRYIFEK